MEYPSEGKVEYILVEKEAQDLKRKMKQEKKSKAKEKRIVTSKGKKTTY